MGEKLNLKNMDVVDWLYKSNIKKEEWIKSEKDKIIQNSIQVTSL